MVGHPLADSSYVSHRSEILGQLCRWTLLTATSGAVAAACWAGVLGACGSAAEPPRLAISDAICRPVQKVYLGGYLSPVVEHPGQNLLISQCDMGYGAPYTDGEHVWAPLRGLPGRHHVRFRGVPYGTGAFLDAQADLLVVMPGEPVYLVDARVPLAISDFERRQLTERLSGLSRFGPVVLFQGGPIDQVQANSRALRAMGFQQPIVWQRAKIEAGPVVTLGALQRALKADLASVTVLTADKALAGRAKKLGFVIGTL